MRLNLFMRRSGGNGGKPRGPLVARLLAAVLRPLGPSWAASPFRRLAQALCLLLFLFLFFYVCWPYGSRHHADAMRARELIEAEALLALDPLVSVSTAIAARAWVSSLVWAGAILLVCVTVPRGFCGYVCPFGTLIDLFDWAAGKRLTRVRLERRGWWVHLRYCVLTAVLLASACGVLVGGFVAAIPVLTRGMLFIVAPVQMGLMRGWYLVPPMHAGHYLSIGLFVLVFGLGFLAPRFWCRYVCPTGAIFSLLNAARLERRVKPSCIQCGECVAACPFDAIQPDFATRGADCTLCQTCGGVCPVGAIDFVTRWTRPEAATEAEVGVAEVALSRRGLLAGAVCGGAAALGVRLSGARGGVPVRAPGSVPEREFLRRCIRCGECMKACPFSVLQPAGFERGIEALWTPQVVADWAGCEPTCNLCGQVCPTGAIRALPLAEKRVARMGLGIVDETTCLPHAEREACQICVDECTAAGYDAIEFIRVGVELDDEGFPIDGSGYSAPTVLADKCVGCGICQSRCYGINVKQKHLLRASAIVVEAGPGKEDRISSGSYLALREHERKEKERQRQEQQGQDDSYLPPFLE